MLVHSVLPALLSVRNVVLTHSHMVTLTAVRLVTMSRSTQVGLDITLTFAAQLLYTACTVTVDILARFNHSYLLTSK